MRFRDAKKLHNRDEVKVRISGTRHFEYGYVLGEPYLSKDKKIIFVPVQSPTDGFHTVTHKDVR